MKVFMGALLGAMIISSPLVAQEAATVGLEPPPTWAWITTCTTVSQEPVTLFEEKSGDGSSFQSNDYITFVDATTGETYYRYLMSADILCIMMPRKTYESRSK